ncbi:MAG TPA: hypothetical protein PLJ00_13535 [Chitinophagales bacterium]|nr:hypothetical protein [Chitinophagales bacterium]
MKYLFMTLFMTFLLHPAIAQNSSANKSNTIYIEGLGIGMLYSINYERQVQIKESNWGFSLSGGIAPKFVDPQYLYFPFRLYANYQIGNSEIGAGINYMFGYYWFHIFIHPEDVNRSSNAYFLPDINYTYFLNFRGFMKFNLLFVNNINNYKHGYLAYLPFSKLQLEDKNFVVWPGLSFGYSF